MEGERIFMTLKRVREMWCGGGRFARAKEGGGGGEKGKVGLEREVWEGRGEH